MTESQKQKSRWPKHLWLVRHGESSGNVARDNAHRAGASRIDIRERDVDIPLSERGETQAAALGLWFAGAYSENERPEVVLTSPYLRAKETARLIGNSRGLAAPEIEPCSDERLREREFGILDGLTSSGIKSLHPDQAAFRLSIGKFYHRPPGGESWCDVILRLRSALDTLSLHHADKRVLIVGHQVVVLCLRYLLENLTESEILAIDAEGDVANCSVTEYVQREDGKQMVLRRYNDTSALKELDAPVTTKPDMTMAAR